VKPQHYENTIAFQLVQLTARSVIFQVRHFHALQFVPSFSGPSLSRSPIFSAAHWKYWINVSFLVLLLFALLVYLQMLQISRSVKFLLCRWCRTVTFSISLYSSRYVNFTVFWLGILCVVWRTDWLHIHHSQLYGTMGEMVEGPWAGAVYSSLSNYNIIVYAFSASLKQFWMSNNIWWSCGKTLGSLFFCPTVYKSVNM